MNKVLQTLVLDGGLATEMERRGHSLADHLWSARLLRDSPETIVEIHREYLHAGADVITSCSYQASIDGYVRAGVSHGQAIELLRESIRAARRAIAAEESHVSCSAQQPLVAASIGPYGACLGDGSEYRGQYGVSKISLNAFHEERWAILEEEKPDVMLIETLPSFDELVVLLDLIDCNARTPVWISFQCRDAFHLADGTSLFQCLDLVNGNKQVEAVGVNCVAPSQATSVLEHLVTLTELPLLACPNSGERWDAHNKCWCESSREERVAGQLSHWNELPMRAVGGCCRTRPNDIAEIAAWVQSKTTLRKI
ncbi:MAG: homocysteine S-methyltransferase [Pirellulaceae bacterium]